MNIERIKQLIEIVKETGIAELEVREGETLIRVVAESGNVTSDGEISHNTTAANTSTHSAHIRSNALSIDSPMAGTFYRSPAPEMPPFVEVGQRVEVGDVLCIIESMKMMNEIKSKRIGTIVDIAVENGQAIGSGTTMFYIN